MNYGPQIDAIAVNFSTLCSLWLQTAEGGKAAAEVHVSHNYRLKLRLCGFSSPGERDKHFPLTEPHSVISQPELKRWQAAVGSLCTSVSRTHSQEPSETIGLVTSPLGQLTWSHLKLHQRLHKTHTVVSVASYVVHMRVFRRHMQCFTLLWKQMMQKWRQFCQTKKKKKEKTRYWCVTCCVCGFGLSIKFWNAAATPWLCSGWGTYIIKTVAALWRGQRSIKDLLNKLCL